MITMWSYSKVSTHSILIVVLVVRLQTPEDRTGTLTDKTVVLPLRLVQIVVRTPTKTGWEFSNTSVAIYEA